MKDTFLCGVNTSEVTEFLARQNLKEEWECSIDRLGLVLCVERLKWDKETEIGVL